MIFFLSTNDSQIGHNKNTNPEEKTEEQQVNGDEKDSETDQDEESDNAQNELEDKDGTEHKVRNIISDVFQSTVNFFKKKDWTIVAVGDSLTQGVGDSQNQGGYVGIIDRAINEEEQHAIIHNYGKRGDRTDQLLLRIEDPKVATSISEADIVLITIGANDIMQVVKENFTHLTYRQFADERIHYEERLRTVFDEIQSLNDESDIYLIGFYNPFDKYFPEIKELGLIVDDWNAIGEKVVQDYSNATYIPTKDLFIDEESELLADDHFHPNDEGYERMARRVLNYITEKDR